MEHEVDRKIGGVSKCRINTVPSLMDIKRSKKL